MSSLPLVLQHLLQADEQGEPQAWEAFVAEYSRLVLHVARALGGEHDAVMDRYVYVLEKLRADGKRRLRGYVADGRGKFSTWLIVVARRLCLDEVRARYGRPQGSRDRKPDAGRRALADLLCGQLDESHQLATDESSPEAEVIAAQDARIVASAIETLPVGDRLLLRLRFEDGLSVPEIARVLGEPSAFVLYRRLEKLLRRLRAELETLGVDARTA